jgi:hypothetical protein
MTWLRVHYEEGPKNTEPYLAQILIPTEFPKDKPWVWGVAWSKTLQPGETYDVATKPPSPIYDILVQFVLAPGSRSGPAGMVRYSTSGCSNGGTVTVNAEEHIVVSS